MNAANRFLTVAAIAAGALAACRQELSPGAQSEAVGAERRPSDAKYNDGAYNFYFKNYSHIYGDCDGYNSEPSGKTTIYEYFQSEINKWEKRLKAAGINPEVYRTSKTDKYCWVRFDTDLLNGVGLEDLESRWWASGSVNGETDILTKNGTRLNFKSVRKLYYAPARGNFYNSLNSYLFIEQLSEAQKKRNVPALFFMFLDGWEKDFTKAENALRAAGVSVIETGNYDEKNYIIADAQGISWFAYNP